MPVLTIIFIIFIIWLQYELRKGKKLSSKGLDKFWEDERASNLTRRADISNLDYITIPLDQLPMSDHEDPTINSYRDSIRKLSDKKILNLSGLTNTELKLKYGAASITSLSEYDNNYTSLVSILQRWGERLNLNGFTTEAISVLEFAASCRADVHKTYQLLSAIYKEQNTPEKINGLIEIIPTTKMLRKDKLIEELKQLMNS